MIEPITKLATIVGMTTIMLASVGIYFRSMALIYKSRGHLFRAEEFLALALLCWVVHIMLWAVSHELYKSKRPQ